MAGPRRREPFRSDSRATVLVVDDSEICLDMARLALEDNGFRVVTVQGPSGFLETLEAERPDIVLMDLTMPGATGDELIERARDSAGHVCPMVLYSDRPEAELVRASTRCGASGYLRKSSSPTELARLLLRVSERACP